MTDKDMASVGSKFHVESTELGILVDVNGTPSEVAFLMGNAIRYFAECVHEEPMEAAMRLGLLAKALSKAERVAVDITKLRKERQP